MQKLLEICTNTRFLQTAQKLNFRYNNLFSKYNEGVAPLDALMIEENKIVDIIQELLGHIEEQAKDTPQILDKETYAKAQLLIEGDLKKFDKEKRQELHTLLANVLNLPEDEIKILRVTSGSVRVILEIPKKAIQRLREYIDFQQGAGGDLGSSIKMIEIRELDLEEHEMLKKKLPENRPEDEDEDEFEFEDEELDKHQFFRATSGAIIINSVGQVLAFERVTFKDSWQFIQGGIDANESPRDSIEREIQEETGIKPTKELELIRQYGWTIYELPEKMMNQWTGRGQVQMWFLYKIKDDTQIDLSNTIENEFSQYRWMEIDKLVEKIIPFKKPVYIKIKAWLEDSGIVGNR